MKLLTSIPAICWDFSAKFAIRLKNIAIDEGNNNYLCNICEPYVLNSWQILTFRCCCWNIVNRSFDIELCWYMWALSCFSKMPEFNDIQMNENRKQKTSTIALYYGCVNINIFWNQRKQIFVWKQLFNKHFIVVQINPFNAFGPHINKHGTNKL